jgi:GAF domain-containing protein
VFDAILEKAHRLCGIDFGGLQIQDGGKYRSVAVRGMADSLTELLRQPVEPVPGSPPSRLLTGERIVHIADMVELARQRIVDARAQAVAEHGFRTGLFVPLRKDADLLGYIVAFRREVLPYSQKEIALLESFAAQAVIAIENGRLLTETREALEQQTATAEVLGVINSSPGDLAPVFDAILEKARRLCEAPFGHLRTWDGECFHLGAVHGEPQFRDWVRQRGPIRPDRYDDATPLGRIIAGERVVSFVDVPGDERYRTSHPGFSATADVLGVINSSPGDLVPVFDAILEKAMRLCDADSGQFSSIDGELFTVTAIRGESRLTEWLRHRGPVRPAPETTMGKILRGENIIQVVDMKDDDAYRRGDPTRRMLVDVGGYRSGLSIALRKEGRLLGAFSINRKQVRPFTGAKQEFG